MPRNVLHVHKVILEAASDSELWKPEMREPRITISQEDNERLMTGMIKSAYGFTLDVTSVDDILSMIRLADKYRFDALVQSLQSYLRESSRTILESEDSYCHLSYDDFMLLLSSVVTFQSGALPYSAIQSWIAKDEVNRKGHCYELLDAVKKRALHVVSNHHFDPAYCGTVAVLSHDNKRLKKNSEVNNWTCAAMGATRCNRYSIKLLNNCSALMVGMAEKSPLFKKEGSTYSVRGWYLYTANGALYSQSGDNGSTVLASPCVENGTVITVELSNGDLRYWINGEDKGVAYRGLYGDLCPAFDIKNAFCEFEFI